jgi:tRNA dimethylallyltransferase
MIENGLVEEVRELLQFRNLNGLQTVGYSEIFDYLHAKISLKEAVELIKKNTRQYAKRQVTWFKKDKEIKWFQPPGLEEIKNYLKSLTI